MNKELLAIFWLDLKLHVLPLELSSCLFLKYVPTLEETYGECLPVGYVSCARNPHALYRVPGRDMTCCF